MQWDVFISHASEDKDEVARPLTDRLQLAGLRVWLDENELQLGDSLSERIDQDLAQSPFGVVIVSRAFLVKAWPKREPAGLVTLEVLGRNVILPIWHRIGHEEIAEYSPTLAEKFAVSTAKGLDYVADKVANGVFSRRGKGIFDSYHASDRQWFEDAFELFNRPAFRGKYLGWTGHEPFQFVLSRIVKALNTGVVENRDGTVRKTIKPMKEIKDKKLFAAMLDLADRLKAIDNLISSHSPYPGKFEDVVAEIDKNRDSIVRKLNEIWQCFGIHTLPIPTAVTTTADAYGRGEADEGTAVV
jgi:hypothetical protein